MNFLSIDQHISVIADIRYIFNQLGHTVREISLSGHAPLIGRQLTNVPMLSGDGWCTTLQERKFKEFYDTYKDMFSQFDGFICCYPPIFSMLYKYFKKPIIVQIPIRYECGADCNPELWEEFNEYLRNGVDEGMIFLCANSRYDQKYASGFIDRDIEYIPSLCEYTGMSYNPVIDQIIYYSLFHVKDESGRMIKKHDAMQGGHAWQCVAEFKGIIHYPYNVSTMSTFEQYTANIPLFFPTKRYLLEMMLNEIPILHQLSWQQQSKTGKSYSLIKHNFEFDPNNFQDFNCVKHWLNYADFYSNDPIGLQCIRHFDNIEERQKVLSMSKDELIQISREMKQHNEMRKEAVYSRWEGLLNEIKSIN